MVVGDDDQSIYRFRGASFAAFDEFDRRFSARRRTTRTRRHPARHRAGGSSRTSDPCGRVLDAANRLIGRNATRFEPDKRLWTERPEGLQVQVVVCAGAEDEAVAIVDGIRERLGEDPNWSDAAVLYRKHKHREAIVARLRDEDIPYTVVGGLSLFATPEIRDLEQALRAIADPHDDVALTRVMTAGPWRLDALEILHVTPHRALRPDAPRRRRHRDRRRGREHRSGGRATAPSPRRPATRAKLRRLLTASTSSTTRPGARARTRSSSAASS